VHLRPQTAGQRSPDFRSVVRSPARKLSVIGKAAPAADEASGYEDRAGENQFDFFDRGENVI